MTKAQKPGKLYGFGFGFETGVSPDVGRTQFVSLSVTVRYSLHAGPGLASIALGWMASRLLWDFQIPVRAGYKLLLSKNFFVMGELGYYYVLGINPYAFGGNVSSRGISFAPSLGVQFGIFELGARYVYVVNYADLSAVGICLAWDF